MKQIETLYKCNGCDTMYSEGQVPSGELCPNCQTLFGGDEYDVCSECHAYALAYEDLCVDCKDHNR